jgi:hypothetical protein
VPIPVVEHCPVSGYNSALLGVLNVAQIRKSQVIASIPLARHPGRPRQVLVAIALLGGAFLLGLVRFALMKNRTFSLPILAVPAVLLAINWWWLYMLWRRVNWVRWVTLILGCLGCLSAFQYVKPLREPVQIAIYWTQLGLTLSAVVLLVMPRTQIWYKGTSDA